MTTSSFTNHRFHLIHGTRSWALSLRILLWHWSWSCFLHRSIWMQALTIDESLQQIKVERWSEPAARWKLESRCVASHCQHFEWSHVEWFQFSCPTDVVQLHVLVAEPDSIADRDLALSSSSR